MEFHNNHHSIGENSPSKKKAKLEDELKEERIAKEFHVNEKYDDDNSSSKMDTIEMNDSGFDSFIEDREEPDEEEKRSKIFEESEDDEKMKKDENEDQIDARIENDHDDKDEEKKKDEVDNQIDDQIENIHDDKDDEKMKQKDEGEDQIEDQIENGHHEKDDEKVKMKHENEDRIEVQFENEHDEKMKPKMKKKDEDQIDNDHDDKDKDDKMIPYIHLLTRNPALQHLAEEILLNLNHEDFEEYMEVDESWKKIIYNPSFLLRKCIQLGYFEKTKSAWKTTVQLTKSRDEEFLTEHFFDVLNMETFHPDVSPIYLAAIYGYSKIIQAVAASSIDDPNASEGSDGDTPMHAAAREGHLDVIKVLAPLSKNPNAPNSSGWTPIHEAAREGHANVIKVLAPFIDNPNALRPDGETPIYAAAKDGNSEVVKVLATLSRLRMRFDRIITEDPNAPNPKGMTPIFIAAKTGHTDVVKVLAPLANNPNAPGPSGLDEPGQTPMEVANNKEIVKILQAYLKPPIDSPSRSK